MSQALQPSLFRTIMLWFATGCAIAASGQVGISPGPLPLVPAVNAMLDMNDVTRGFLAPRMSAADRAAIPAPPNSLLVYQTDSVAATGAGRGYYYYDTVTAQWVRVGSPRNWQLGGNAGTDPATNFIGTYTNVEVDIRTNGLARTRLNTTGQVQVGPAPFPALSERLDINGALRIVGTSATTPTEGAIRFNSSTGAHDGYVLNPLGGGQIQYVGWHQLENVFGERVKQKYPRVAPAPCAYPAPDVPPTGAGGSGWLTIDANGAAANPVTASTLETPFSTSAEDARHQYLYKDEDFIALGICPNTPITGLAFRTAAAGTAMGMRNVRISLKNTQVEELNDFEYGGLVLCATLGTYPAAPLVVTNGWNAFTFNVAPFQWLGPGYNVVVEFAFDNQDWTFNTAVFYENTTYNATFGIYCDACGSPNPGGTTCYYPGPTCPVPTPNNSAGVWNAPTGPSSTAAGVLCTGWGWGGFQGGGPSLTTATSLVTCDGTTQYRGRYSQAMMRPIIKFRAQTSGAISTVANGNYLLAREGITIGDHATWANSALYAPGPNYVFKGPGTLSVRSSVWGGGVLLNDHVFDKYYDGEIRVEDEGNASGFEHYSIPEMSAFVKRERHLPTIGGRADWAANGPFSLDKLTNQMWVTAEQQALYLKEIHERIKALETLLLERALRKARRSRRQIEL